MSQNEFLTELLTLQQDGQAAISGPINWGKPPLLEVRTGLHTVVESLLNSMLDKASVRGTWHFFVGSPGNGKSAGAGMLVQKLRAEGQLVFEGESKRPIDEFDPAQVPYRLDVHRPGEAFPYLYIAQDASVLPNPFDDTADPAEALIRLLMESAERGVSLVVCTNRGVIERAFSVASEKHESKSTAWCKALRKAVGASEDVLVNLDKASKKRVFESVNVTVTSLDRRSLVLKADTFDRLIQNAVAPERWKACEGCGSKSLCPFSANRDWLADQPLRHNVLRLVLHAELISGQVIVLREALALISLMLAGCPHDYDTASPCDWVHSKIAEGALFSLASRRIYMLLFSAYSPVGLADDPSDLKGQAKDIEFIARLGAGISDRCRQAVVSIHKREWPSTDVGAQRLLGRGGIFSELDVLSGVPDLSFSDRWSESWDDIPDKGVWRTPIEDSLAECWAELMQAAANSNQQLPSIYRSLTRWITAFSLRIGSLVEGESAFNRDLDSLVEILEIEGQPTAAQANLLTSVAATLQSSLSVEEKGLLLTPTTTLHGDWAETALKPKFALSADGSLSATLKFGNSDKNLLRLNSRAFVWLKRRAERNMDPATFPRDYLETARDAMIRVATTSSYDIQDDVVLRVQVDDQQIEIRRSHGGVYVERT